jgi:hypothetical protein
MLRIPSRVLRQLADNALRSCRGGSKFVSPILISHNVARTYNLETLTFLPY